MKISYTSVAIDVFHYGQLKLLQQAKKISDYHICGLYTDEICLNWNGSLVMKYNERLAMLDAIKYVDEVLEQKKLDPTENLKLIENKFPGSKIIFFQGHQDWEGMPGANYIKSIGGDIIKPDFYSKITRSSIRNELNKTIETKIHDIESYLLGDVSYFPLYNSTKANTLASLKPQLKKSFIEQLFVFTKQQWENSTGEILNQISNKFTEKIVVRSSSHIEDGFFSTYAGFFHSELDVDSQNSNKIKKAVSNVIKSYSKHRRTTKKEQILVQSQTKNVVCSGVVFTRNIQNNSPYYFINYDKSSSTDSVTSGKVGNKIEIIKNIESEYVLPEWKSLIEAVKEIEELLENLALDLEFAIDGRGKIIIFQVRPIATKQRFKNIPDDEIFDAVDNLKKQYKSYSKSSLVKSSYTLSDMSFWNPAEIIGDRSDNLSYSIYRHLILHRAWNTGLVTIGYKEITRDLIVRFGNKSYIEVETAFMALMPENLDKEISDKLILFYLNKLEKKPELHDKIEFDIVHNCFSPITDNQLSELSIILSKSELNIFRNKLINLTDNIFSNYEKIKRDDLDSLNLLTSKRDKLINQVSRLSLKEKISIVIELLSDAKKYGTPQFARMARLAFIGNQYIKSFVSVNIITESEKEFLLSNIETVASELTKDFNDVMNKKISVDEFNSHYGHLRPGTYDITKLPYKKDIGYFNFDQPVRSNSINVVKSNKSLRNIINKISKYLINFDISVSAEFLISFITETTKFRESFKFEFTKNLSWALEILSEVGSELGFSRKQLSNLSVESLMGITSSTSISEIKDFWESQINGNLANNKIYHYVGLPSLIFGLKDFESIQSHTVRPNFITNNLIRGKILNLDSISVKNYESVKGKVILLEKADPGYDWVFSKDIIGLITRFGGAASHMAIRCAEFGIPAAIGVGEMLFKEINNSHIIELDCTRKKVSIIA